MTYKSSVLEDLAWRGLIFQTTHEELDQALLEAEQAGEGLALYCGFDPSADSLHIGNLLAIFVLANFRRHGHSPIALAGGATGLIGDPSGKSDERNLLTEETITKNLEGISAQLREILDRAMTLHPKTRKAAADGGEIPVVNNADWIKPWSFIGFLRDVGKNFRVNTMLQKDSVKSRLEQREQGLSYTEFSYMLIQAYDFLHLYRERGCRLQVGGSDQWGNITAGTDLIGRMESNEKKAFGLTFPLITSASGQKLGKSEKGATYLAPERNSPYEFYQYWVNRDDADVPRFLRMFTFLPRERVDELSGLVERGENRGEAQRELAWEVTRLVHGDEGAEKAIRASRMMFGEKIEDLSDAEFQAIFADVPSTEITREQLEAGVPLFELFVLTGLTKSNGEARRLLDQGGVYVNNTRIDDSGYVVGVSDLVSANALVLRAGKKKYHVVSVS